MTSADIGLEKALISSSSSHFGPLMAPFSSTTYAAFLSSPDVLTFTSAGSAYRFSYNTKMKGIVQILRKTQIQGWHQNILHLPISTCMPDTNKPTFALYFGIWGIMKIMFRMPLFQNKHTVSSFCIHTRTWQETWEMGDTFITYHGIPLGQFYNEHLSPS